MKDLVERIVGGISHQPIRIEEEYSGVRSVNYQCHVHADDMGLVMGSGAANIKAIQKLFKLVAINSRMVHIGVYLRRPSKEFTRYKTFKPGWSEDVALDLARDIIQAAGHEIVGIRLEPKSGGIIVYPSLSKELLDIVHTILENYGKSYGKHFGITFE